MKKSSFLQHCCFYATHDIKTTLGLPRYSLKGKFNFLAFFDSRRALQTARLNPARAILGRQ
jgi:hypothetical protein